MEKNEWNWTSCEDTVVELGVARPNESKIVPYSPLVQYSHGTSERKSFGVKHGKLFHLLQF